HSVNDQIDASGKNVGVTIFLCPVYDPDPASENAQFFRWTPWGRIELGTVNPAAAAHFSQGAEVYVDFTPAIAPEPGSR
ncbi:MAG TPA: hypothetical protein PLF63_11570, partial [Rubrivivax sp.]|nr:hypothetical protein [Rubrivivax sp.]